MFYNDRYYESDVVLATYANAENDFWKYLTKSLCQDCPTLHHIMWGRIVFDEAHYIKDGGCNTIDAIDALRSLYRWAAIRTPQPIDIGEFYLLVRLLKISPYSYYLCDVCECQLIHRRPDHSCEGCHHLTEEHYSWWKTFVGDPPAFKGKEGTVSRAKMEEVLNRIVLTRNRDLVAAYLILPPRIVVKREEDLDVSEKKFYETLLKKAVEIFDDYVRQERVSVSFAHLFELLTRLRLAANHPFLEQMRIINKIGASKFKTGTKIDALKEELFNMHQRDGSAKAVVFSEFPEFIDLVDLVLQQYGIQTILLSRSMKLAEREFKIKNFLVDPNKKILLSSFKVGVVGVNLSAAVSYVFLMEPWWDPLEEKLAHDVIHGFGQYRPTRVVTFVAKTTIEESILELQSMKKVALKSSGEGSGKISGNDIRYLYSKCKETVDRF